jgi:hypothetical protein
MVFTITLFIIVLYCTYKVWEDEADGFVCFLAFCLGCVAMAIVLLVIQIIIYHTVINFSNVESKQISVYIESAEQGKDFTMLYGEKDGISYFFPCTINDGYAIFYNVKIKETRFFETKGKPYLYIKQNRYVLDGYPLWSVREFSSWDTVEVQLHLPKTYSLKQRKDEGL